MSLAACVRTRLLALVVGQAVDPSLTDATRAAAGEQARELSEKPVSVSRIGEYIEACDCHLGFRRSSRSMRPHQRRVEAGERILLVKRAG
jgi:hypothetical protein